MLSNSNRIGCRTVSAVAAIGMTLLLSPRLAPAQSEYQFFLVESFNPGYSLAETALFGINASNIGVGSDTFGGFTWTEATGKTQLPWNSSKGINNPGWINYTHSIYQPSTQQQITIPEPSAAYPIRSLIDLSDNMVGVGVASHGGSGCEPFDCPYDCGKAFVWDQVNGARHVNVPDLKAFHAVNNNNIAVGVIIVNCDDNRGVVYDLNTDQWTNLSDLLPPLDLINRPAQIWPTDINDSGQVIGLALYGSEPEKPFIWTAETGFTFLPIIPGGEYGYMYVNSINNNGVVVGEALDGTVMNWKSFVWDPANGIRLLEDLVDEPANFQIERANAINDNGWIVGSGHFGPGWATQRGFVLKPVVQSVPGDIDGNGIADMNDIASFVNVLTGADEDPDRVAASDLNGDGSANGLDVTVMVDLLLNG